MYSLWRIEQLKEELRKRGASLRGKKADLVVRLEAYDRNFNFENVREESFSTRVPEEQLFRDVNSDTLLPPLTKEYIHLYFSKFNKKTDDGFQLYESRYLLILRSTQVGNDTFLKGVCKAAMKKIQYEVNCKILFNGNIEESTCECAVGSGTEAHCKHVAVILFAAEEMGRKKTMITHVVCTQQLQSFHKPKKVFTASPLKAERLPSKRKLENIIFHPYPVETLNKENFNARVRNICIGATSSTMPMKQIFGPANPHAIFNDHAYETEDARDILCKNLQINTITSQEVQEIELHTRGQAKNPEWHEKRQNRITASRFHTVCHLKAESQKKFAEQLINPRKFSSRATTHGIINEPVAIKSYMDASDLIVRECGLFISKERPYLAATPDGLLGEETIIEVKCPYASRYQEIDETSVPYLYKEGNQLSLKKSCIYYYQIQGQLYCTGKMFCNLIIFTFNDMKVIYISRDNAFIDYMLKKLDSFYETFFKEALLNKYIYRNYYKN